MVYSAKKPLLLVKNTLDFSINMLFSVAILKIHCCYNPLKHWPPPGLLVGIRVVYLCHICLVSVLCVSHALFSAQVMLFWGLLFSGFPASSHKNMLHRLNGASNLLLRVGVSLSVCGPAIDCQTILGLPSLQATVWDFLCCFS